MKQLKVHVGCGRNYIPGWTNVDIFSSVKADVYADMSALPFDRESIDCLYCCHCLEHAHRHMIIATLTHWRDLLKPGGILRLAVPNFAAVVEWYNKTGNLDDVMGLLYAGQNHPKNFHTVTFDSNTLRRDLIRAGFNTVQYWDWRKTEHAQFDDFSQASLPLDPVTRKPLDKFNDLSVSLNMEAVK